MGQNVGVHRIVSVDLDITVFSAARLAVQIGVAAPENYATTETIAVTIDSTPIEWRELAAPNGGRIWLVDADAGRVHIKYGVSITGTAPPPPAADADQLLYLRPSRYCESDRMIGFAARLFHDIQEPGEILAAVSSWVGTQLEYVSGSSGPTDGAVDTLLAGRGVCRDFAHLGMA